MVCNGYPWPSEDCNHRRVCIPRFRNSDEVRMMSYIVVTVIMISYLAASLLITWVCCKGMLALIGKHNEHEEED